MSELASNPYDEVPYRSFPFAQTHPVRVATIGSLFGLPVHDIERTRVLELGCSSGGNLLPLAESIPQGRYVGIDASQVAIDKARLIAARLGLDNVVFLQKNILEIGNDLGEFDVIVTHGVFSWVPEVVQSKILEICSRHLAPRHRLCQLQRESGLRTRGMIRDLMLYRASFFQDAQERLNQARELIDFLAKSVTVEKNPYGMILNEELKLLQGKESYYLIHEFLEDINKSLYFHEFMQQAGRQGLRYLGEADFSMMSVNNFPPQIARMLQKLSNDEIQMEQYMDFVRNRMFRQTLLCRAEVELDRTPRADRIFAMHVASSAEPEAPITELRSRDKVLFRRSGSTLTTTDPLVKAAMLVLRERWPRQVGFRDLLAAARAKLNSRPLVIDANRDRQEAVMLAEPLLRCYSTNMVDLSARGMNPAIDPPEFPQTTRLARYQAEQQRPITNLWHASTTVTDVQRHIIRRCDGQHNREQLVDCLASDIAEGLLNVHSEGKQVQDCDQTRSILVGLLEPNLQELGRKGLFLPEELTSHSVGAAV